MNRFFRTLALAPMLGLVALGLSARPAAAQIDPMKNPMVAGAGWQGFGWDPANAPNGGVGLAVWSSQGASFTGGVSIYGRGRVVNGRVGFADGSVDIVEANSTAPMQFHGIIAPTAQGGFIATLRVSQLTRNLGTVKLLWLRRLRASDGSFPPGPCLPGGAWYAGRFVGSGGDQGYQTGGSGINGLIALLFDPQRPVGDSAQPLSLETGAMVMQDLHFRFVATIDPVGAGGTYGFDLLGQSNSALLPAVRLGGAYQTDPVTGKQLSFQGSYLLYNSLFNPFSEGTFSAFAP